MRRGGPGERPAASDARRRWPALAVVAAAGALVAALAAASGSAPPDAPGTFGLYAVWFAGAGDESRAELDRFLGCVVDGSNLNHY